MKKIVLLSLMFLVSCVSQKTVENREPAQTGNVGSFSAKVGDQAYVCKAICEVFIPMEYNDAKLTLQLGPYVAGTALVVSNALTQEAAIESLKNKCSEASSKNRIYKSLHVDLSIPTESLSDKTVAYRPEDVLTSNNSNQFCEQGTVTEYIHYASNKMVNIRSLQLRPTHRKP